MLECNGTKANLEHAASIQVGIGAADDYDVRFDRLLPAFLKTDGKPRAMEASGAMQKRLGADSMAELLALHERLGDRLLAVRRQRDEERVLQFHRQALQAADGFLGTFEQFKLQRQLLDYADLEWHTDRLLHDEASAAFSVPVSSLLEVVFRAAKGTQASKRLPDALCTRRWNFSSSGENSL